MSGFARLITRLNDRRGVAAGTFSSLVVRSAGVVTTLVAMPIALHTLGEVRFGTFLLLFGVINWITLGNVGVHSALGRAIASKSLPPGELPNMLGATLLYATATTLVTAVVVYGGFIVWRATAGAQLPIPLDEITAAATTMIVLSALQIILQVFEGVQIGELKLYTANYVRLAGSIFSFACLLTLPRYWPAMSVFVIALNGGPLLSTILNAGLVMRKVRPHFANLRDDLRQLQAFAVSGLAYLAIGIAALLETHLPVLVLATLHGPVAAIGFGLLIRLFYVMMTAFAMVTAPLWPALLNARADADQAWIRRMLTITALLVVGAGAVSGLAIALFSDPIIWWWTGHVMTESAAFKMLFGFYFLQSAWSHYWATVLMGLGRERRVAAVLIAEGVAMVVLGSLLSLSFGTTGMIGGMVIAALAFSTWRLPKMAEADLRWMGRIAAVAKNGVAAATRAGRRDKS
jgi:O-antigen/teichoic acid export membrane protein